MFDMPYSLLSWFELPSTASGTSSINNTLYTSSATLTKISQYTMQFLCLCTFFPMLKKHQHHSVSTRNVSNQSEFRLTDLSKFISLHLICCQNKLPKRNLRDLVGLHFRGYSILHVCRDLLMSSCNSPPASAAGRPKLALSRSVGLGDGKAKGEGPRGVADRLPAVLRGVLAALPRCCRRMWSDISCEQAWCPCITAQSSADQPSNIMQTKKSNYHSFFTCTPHWAWQLQEICNPVISLFQLNPFLHTVARARKWGQLSVLHTCCVKWSKVETHCPSWLKDWMGTQTVVPDLKQNT